MNLTHHAYYIEGDLSRFDEYTKAISHFVAQNMKSLA